MGDPEQGGKWIAPEEVPDPIALRGHSVARVPSTPPPSRVELGTLDPLDPPSLEVVQVARAAETKLWEAAEPTDFSLDPTPPPAAEVQDHRVVVAGSRQLPAAVWVGGTLLLVAVLSMGLRMLTAGAGATAPEPPAPAQPEVRPSVAPSSHPVPVDAAGALGKAFGLQASPQGKASAKEPAPARLRSPPAEENPPRQAAVRPTADAAPPTATLRPLTPPASASLEPDSRPVNPWSEVEP